MMQQWSTLGGGNRPTANEPIQDTPSLFALLSKMQEGPNSARETAADFTGSGDLRLSVHYLCDVLRITRGPGRRDTTTAFDTALRRQHSGVAGVQELQSTD
jgi:hypothetical protein